MEKLFTKGHWIARARDINDCLYEKQFPYTANGNYIREQEEQYKYECWLMENIDDIVWYSVDYEE